MKLLIMCIGNREGGDDSIGPYIADNLLKLNLKKIDVIDCGVVPENYTSIVKEKNPDKLIIIDAIDMGLSASEIRVIPENKIGKMPPVHGNRVVIDHGNGEYSIIAHFKMGSIVVKKNSFVKQGQLLGLCGNSGQSSEPHIHYHLQNSPDIDHGEGLPVKFYSYLSNGKHIEVGEPKIGEQVKNY